MDVTDFNATDANTSTDIGITGGSIINFDHFNGSNSTYRFDIIPDRDPQRIFLTFHAGAAVDGWVIILRRKSWLFPTMIRLLNPRISLVGGHLTKKMEL